MAPYLVVTGGKQRGDRTTEAATAREYALAHGGRIDVQDRPDGKRGACFRLSLPQGAPLDAVSIAAPSAVPSPHPLKDAS